MVVYFGSIEVTETSNRSKQFKTPDIKIVQYIEKFSTSACIEELSFTVVDPIKAAIACMGINASANSTPADYFTDSSWNTFKASKDYRGYTHIPSVQIICEDSKILSYTTPTTDFSYGYTKIPLVGFDESEAYTALPFNRFHFMANRDNNTLIIQDQRAARLSQFTRVGQAVITNYDPPFIYTQMHQTIRLDSSQIIININRTIFPTTKIYINNQLIEERKQTNLAKFIKSGLKISDFGLNTLNLSSPGIGNLAPPGDPIILILPLVIV